MPLPPRRRLAGNWAAQLAFAVAAWLEEAQLWGVPALCSQEALLVKDCVLALGMLAVGMLALECCRLYSCAKGSGAV